MAYLLLEDRASHLVLEDGAGSLLLEGEGSGPVVVYPGGTFRRPLPSWLRTLARPLPSWARVWSYAVPQLPVQTLTPVVGDDRDYLIDCSPAPEVAAGGVIASAAVVPGSNSGDLTFGAATASGTVLDGIPAGKAVVLPISGWVGGTVYTFGVRVTLASGRKFTVPCRAVPGGAV